MKSKPVFTMFELTDEEERQGRILSENQIAVLNNDLVDALQRRLALRLDVSNPLAFAQEEAEWSGRIVYIQSVLEQHHEALESLAAQIQQSQSNNQE